MGNETTRFGKLEGTDWAILGDWNLLAASVTASRTGPIQKVNVKTAGETGRLGTHLANMAPVSSGLTVEAVELTGTRSKIWAGDQLLYDQVQPRHCRDNNCSPIVPYP